MADELGILLVEDDPDTQANLADILEMDGYQVRVAGSFGDVRNAGLQPEIDLVILDRRLPDGSLEDALPAMKELLPNAEFIVVTGFADIENTIAAFKLGVTDYMLKPVQPDVIRQSVARIAKQKRVESELRRQQQFANQVLETSETLIVVLDLQCRVLRFNSHFTCVTGWRLEDLVGKDFIAHCVPETEQERIQGVFEVTASGQPSAGTRNGLRTTDGHVRQIRWSDSLLRDEFGQAKSVLAIGIDVTDVVEAQVAAARDHRLAAIGQTVAGLAHESRNALHRINASVEMLRLDIPVDSDLRDEVDSIARASAELHSTLEEVREFAAPVQLHREMVMLHDVWRRVWGYLVRLRSDRDAELVEDICGCGCPVNVDVLRMEQVFRNLFENSLAACEDPVRIRIHCKCDGLEQIQVDIQDNGPGLTIEQREKLFEPFYTTKARGTGLGMSIVQIIIDAHDGEIRVVDAIEGGARFQIRLGKHESAVGGPCCLGSGVSDA
ncbi:hypothetical protein SAMN06265222_101847 [Neorhodopirellula lusitana]|uniref:histidine kinase n=1 Tax=Neorhodopirellula lusitana TaxID=445327 RepID=A0ABY1PU47_9BACT|nr:ATP-binding protein [Neorhodopirellula lusitana]SMP42829.1 hypothetical protein SAMN06265222_101847 [Neorhodopirellula lusitana]